MTTIRPERLRGFTLFANLDERLVQRLASLLRHQQCPVGSTIYAQHDDRREVYVVLRGHVRIIAYSQSGRETIFHDLHAGDMVGQLAAIDGGPRVASLIVMEAAEIGYFEAGAFNQLLREEPSFALVVIHQLARQIRALNQRILLLAAPVPIRVCGELLHLAEQGPSGDNTARIESPPKHVDLANRLNTHREAVSRTLALLQRRGVIERGRGALLVRDLAALRRYAEGQQSLATPMLDRPRPPPSRAPATAARRPAPLRNDSRD